jgi:nitroimidazol reductase NimA-like FMN-containing flavoprotein (pyridoxamine 5'-phosphate oxidase superfamily)
MDTNLKTDRTTSLREKERMTYSREQAHAILDEGWFCPVWFVLEGERRALRTLFVRVDDTVYVHFSTGSRIGLGTRFDAMRVCLSVTHLDGLILARSQFHHSANYRSLVAHGTASLVTDPAERDLAFRALLE